MPTRCNRWYLLQILLHIIARINDDARSKSLQIYTNNIGIYVHNTEDHILAKTKAITGTRSAVFSFSF